jgi:hypothetical protein
MLNMKTPSLIPLDIQLEAACTLRVRDIEAILNSRGFNECVMPSSLSLKDYKHLFVFSADDLLQYLERQPNVCQRLLMDSYDKRYSPSTFIEEWEGKYRVGWYEDARREVQVFEKFAEAATDYVLFSLGLPRLSSSVQVNQSFE